MRNNAMKLISILSVLMIFGDTAAFHVKHFAANRVTLTSLRAGPEDEKRGGNPITDFFKNLDNFIEDASARRLGNVSVPVNCRKAHDGKLKHI